LAERMPDQAGAGTTEAARHANLYTYFEPARSVCEKATDRHQHGVRSKPDVALRLKIHLIQHQRHPAWSAVGVKTPNKSLLVKF